MTLENRRDRAVVAHAADEMWFQRVGTLDDALGPNDRTKKETNGFGERARAVGHARFELPPAHPGRRASLRHAAEPAKDDQRQRAEHEECAKGTEREQ